MIYNSEFEAWFSRQKFPATTKYKWSLIWNNIGGNAPLLDVIIATIQEGQADENNRLRAALAAIELHGGTEETFDPVVSDICRTALMHKESLK